MGIWLRFCLFGLLEDFLRGLLTRLLKDGGGGGGRVQVLTTYKFSKIRVISVYKSSFRKRCLFRVSGCTTKFTLLDQILHICASVETSFPLRPNRVSTIYPSDVASVLVSHVCEFQAVEYSILILLLDVKHCKALVLMTYEGRRAVLILFMR